MPRFPIGNVIQTYQSDEFGVPIQTQGAGTQPFGFTGQQSDAASGLYYLRARMYDPSVGRFMSRDPNGGSRADPLSLNGYIYAQDDPVGQVDPTGLDSKVKSLPVLVIDGDRMPTKAAHILEAQNI